MCADSSSSGRRIALYKTLGWSCVLLSGLFFVLFWPVGLAFLIGALAALAHAKDLERAADYIEHSQRPRGRSLDFGPTGPPWGDNEKPLILGKQTIFASSIRSICEWGAAGPDLRIRNGAQIQLPGTEKEPLVTITLHSGDQYDATGENAGRLGTWFDRVAQDQ